MAATGVSRTVVREAVAACAPKVWSWCGRASAPLSPGRCGGRSASKSANLESLREVIEVMELRAGVEMEAAGLAAERATTARRSRKIAEAFRRIDAPIGRGERRSIRTSRFIAASPRPPAIRNSCAFWIISAASSFRARRSATATVSAGAARLSRAHPERTHGNPPTRSRRRTRQHGARRHAARTLANSRKRYQKLVAEDRRRSGGGCRVIVNFANRESDADSSGDGRGGRYRYADAPAA